MATNVVNINKLTPDEGAKFRAGDPEYVYIGTAIKHMNLRASKWASPYSVATVCKDHKKISIADARRIVNDQYKEYVRSSPKLLNALAELRGKTLVCFCAPALCHGHALIELLESE